MPTVLVVDSSIPAIARTFPLAAALLSSWAHEGHLLGELAAQDAARMLERRAACGIDYHAA